MLESQEFQNTLIDRRVKADAPFVGANRVVELDPVATVDLDLAIVVSPGNPERHDPVRLHHSVEHFDFGIHRVGMDERNYSFGDFVNSLVENCFTRIPRYDPIHKRGQVDLFHRDDAPP